MLCGHPHHENASINSHVSYDECVRTKVKKPKYILGNDQYHAVSPAD